jgi:hypothetical protein
MSQGLLGRFPPHDKRGSAGGIREEAAVNRQVMASVNRLFSFTDTESGDPARAIRVILETAKRLHGGR